MEQGRNAVRKFFELCAPVSLQVDRGEETGDVQNQQTGHHDQLEERQRCSDSPERNGHEWEVFFIAEADPTDLAPLESVQEDQNQEEASAGQVGGL